MSYDLFGLTNENVTILCSPILFEQSPPDYPGVKERILKTSNPGRKVVTKDSTAWRFILQDNRAKHAVHCQNKKYLIKEKENGPLEEQI